MERTPALPPARLYVKLFGKPGFCFETPAGNTPIHPLPTPLWSMLLAYLCLCERQETTLDALVPVWNEACAENTGKPLRAYGTTHSAYAAVTGDITDARRKLVTLYEKALPLADTPVDQYTFLPKYPEKIIGLNPETVTSDVSRFRALHREIQQRESDPQAGEDILSLLKEAQRLYDGGFMAGGDAYFGRSLTRRGGELTRLLRPWIKEEREKLRGEFADIEDRLREHSRPTFKYLPSALDRFIPRTERSEPVFDWLRGRGEYGELPLLLLHGPGGAGKTRLAVETVRSLREAALPRYGDRIYFVPFVSLPHDFGIPAFAGMLARAVHAPKSVVTAGADEIADLLRTWLSENPLRLIILDNFESVTVPYREVGIWLLETLRETNGQVRCLITTQHRFAPHLPHYAVGGMALGESALDKSFPASEGYLLYERRVRETPRVSEEYVLGAPCRLPLWDLLHLVDGLPLAIEMLASRCAGMPPSRLRETARTLQQKQLPFLRDEEPDPLRSHARHTGMRACLAWAWELLTGTEQEAFRRLGVFPDTFTADAALTIAGVSEGELEAFRNLALLHRDSDTERWSLLPMVAEFARERLRKSAEESERYRAYCGYYLGIVEELSPQLHTPQFMEVGKRLDREETNFVWAQEYCAQDRFPDAAEVRLRVAAALRPFRSLRSNRHRSALELQTAFEQASGRKVSTETRRAVLCALIHSLDFQSECSVQVNQRLDNLFGELEKICRTTGNYSPDSLRALGMASGQFERKIAYLQQAIEKYEKSGNEPQKVITMNMIAAVLHNFGKREQSLSLMSSVLSEAVAVGLPSAPLIASNMAVNAMQLEKEALAEEVFHTCLKLCLTHNRSLIASWALFNYATQREDAGRFRESVCLLKYGEKLRLSVSEGQEEFTSQERELIARLRETLGTDAYEEECARTEPWSLDIAVEYALSLPRWEEVMGT